MIFRLKSISSKSNRSLLRYAPKTIENDQFWPETAIFTRFQASQNMDVYKIFKYTVRSL